MKNKNKQLSSRKILEKELKGFNKEFKEEIMEELKKYTLRKELKKALNNYKTDLKKELSKYVTESHFEYWMTKIYENFMTKEDGKILSDRMDEITSRMDKNTDTLDYLVKSIDDIISTKNIISMYTVKRSETV